MVCIHVSASWSMFYEPRHFLSLNGMVFCKLSSGSHYKASRITKHERSSGPLILDLPGLPPSHSSIPLDPIGSHWIPDPRPTSSTQRLCCSWMARPGRGSRRCWWRKRWSKRGRCRWRSWTPWRKPGPWSWHRNAFRRKNDGVGSCWIILDISDISQGWGGSGVHTWAYLGQDRNMSQNWLRVLNCFDIARCTRWVGNTRPEFGTPGFRLYSRQNILIYTYIILYH